MTFSCQVNDPIGFVLIKNSFEFCRIKNVYFFKNIVRCNFNVTQVFKVTCIGQCIEVDDFIIWIFIDKQPDNMRANEAGTAGDEDSHFRNRLEFQV